MTRTGICILLEADSRLGNIGDWQGRHNSAVNAPAPGFERAMVNMVAGLLEYAIKHQAEYESVIGDDALIGDAWAAIATGVIELLNGQTGRLDCGTFDKAIRKMAAEHNAEVK